ncbi:site-specific integrase [Xanthobacter sp. DSM 24535]|uniref:site-specific integrase n=1 Tax=Roseixanthobacter psychrophilus TaxID=3119917 RepID=UPI0037285E09
MASVSKREWTHKGETKSAWIVRYFDAKRRHCQKTFEKKKDADKFRLKVEIELEKNRHISSTDERTVNAICEAFLRSIEDRLEDGRMGRGTQKNYKISIEKGVIPYFGKMKINEITFAHVEGFYKEMIKNRGLHPTTARMRLTKFRNVCQFAIKRGAMAQEPVTAFLQDLRGAKETTVRTFTQDELVRLLKQLEIKRRHQRERCHLRLKCYVHLAVFCGLRFGEISGLTLPCINIDDRVVHVRHSLTDFDELKAPKTRAGVRDVPMPSHVANLLSEWLQQFAVGNERGLIFRQKSGTMHSPSNFHRGDWRPLLRLSGLLADGEEVLHFHALRHFAASWWISQGIGMMEVASLLGHRTFNTTLQTYAHPVIGGHRRREMTDLAAIQLLPPPALDLKPTHVQ